MGEWRSVVGSTATQRRLAAIVVADVVGYSRLMEADEVGTLTALKERRRTILEPTMRSHGGRIVKFTGDGVLIEFPSAVNAVEGMVELQRRMALANETLPLSKRITLRVGVNLGDVIGEGSDIYGDGVNIAARLESLAEPGGILVSGKVYDEVRGKVSVVFEDTGLRNLKNMSTPLRTYRLTDKQYPTGKRTSEGTKPVVAVLPFVNMSGDPGQEQLADGLTEDIITALSYSSALYVIARTSVFAYKGKAADIKQIARELDVDYVLEGSVRKFGESVRVTAQMVEAASGHHVWAEKYDGATQNLFEIQDQITRAVAACTNTQMFLTAWESRRMSREEETTAHKLAVAAMGRIYESNSEAFLEGARMAEEALALDPTSYMAYVARAAALLNQIAEAEVPHTSENIAQALSWAEKAVELGSRDENCYWIKAWALAENGQLAEAVAESERGLEINPNSTLVLGDLGSFCAALGRVDEAIAACELALRLDPRDPSNHWRQFALASAFFLAGKYEKARNLSRKIAFTSKKFVRASLIWAASAAAAGDLDDARRATAYCLAQQPGINLRNTWPQFMFRYERQGDQEKLIAMLRRAGLPE